MGEGGREGVSHSSSEYETVVLYCKFSWWPVWCNGNLKF